MVFQGGAPGNSDSPDDLQPSMGERRLAVKVLYLRYKSQMSQFCRVGELGFLHVVWK